MKEEIVYLTTDSRNRITIPKKLTKQETRLYKIYKKNGKIILEPVKAIPIKKISKEEEWLFDPKNKKIVNQLKKALKQKADKEIDLNELEKSLKE